MIKRDILCDSMVNVCLKLQTFYDNERGEQDQADSGTFGS